MAHVHQLDVCDDDKWHPHDFKFLNHQSTEIRVTPIAGGGRFPFVKDPGFDGIKVPAGGRPAKFEPNLPPGTYSYDVEGCVHLGKTTPKNVIIS
jgi:hypothetical protein